MNRSAQVVMRLWVARMPKGHEFTTKDANAFVVSQGFKPTQASNMLTYCITWWKLIERVKHGHYKRL